MTTRARILVTDDAYFMRSLVAEVLTDAGHEVVGHATNGREAVEQYAALRPDLVTMDVTMPIASGLEALEEIRELDPDARVLMCSALSSDTTRREAERLGAKGYVVKPFTADGLRHAIGEALRET